MNDSINFQLVTQNIASCLEPHLREIGFVAPAWNFYVVFAAIFIIVLNKQMSPSRLKMICSVFYVSSDFEKITREWNPIRSFNGFSVAVSYIALLGLFVQKAVVICSGNTILYDNALFYKDICVYISAYLLIQYLVVNLFGWLFGIEAATDHQEIEHLSMAASINMVLILFLLVLFFYPYKIYVLVAFSICLLFEIIRLVKMFFEFKILSKKSFFNNFLYLCTLEILPIAISITMVFRIVLTDCIL
ncbi:MAG: DUF4271 domain-containing protein [Candidatus Limimorpha sp.]